MRRVAGPALIAVLLLGGCAADQKNTPPAPPNSASADASVVASPAPPRKKLPDLSPPTEASVQAFGDILMKHTLGLLPEERERPNFPYFNVDPDNTTCPGPTETVVISARHAAAKYCDDGTFIYSLAALRRQAAEKPSAGDLPVMGTMLSAFHGFVAKKLQDRNAKAAELTDANYSFCTIGYMHGGLIKAGYLASEADLDWSAEEVYASNLSAPRVYRNASARGECRDPGPVGVSQPGDRANVNVPELCSVIDKQSLNRTTGATRDITSQGDQSGRTDRAPLCRMTFQGGEARWEAMALKLENNVAAMQLCTSERPGFPGMQVHDRPGGVVQLTSLEGGLTTFGMACIRNYTVSITVTRQGWGTNRMLAVLDTFAARVNTHG